MLLFRPMYLHHSFFMTCRCFSACLSCTIASTSCLFWDLRILPSQIFHLHPTFSMPCGCFSLKLRILDLLVQCFADAPHQNFASSIPPNSLSPISSQISFAFYLLHGLSRYLTYKKIDIRNSYEYGTSVGDA